MVASGLPRIRALDPIVVSQIAAGEVVERPASVLRELLDNALDAGATRIEVEVEQGGIERICVADDGCGIAGDDLPLALASHATSKLSSANDLETIATMGFRGEALASIASIAQVELRSVPRGSGAGAIIRSHGGRVDKIEPWLGTSGTRVEVKHLFYNAPVRRRFLKSPAAEMAHFNEVLTRFALAIGALPAEIRPHIILRQGRKTLMDLPGSLEAMDRVERLSRYSAYAVSFCEWQACQGSVVAACHNRSLPRVDDGWSSPCGFSVFGCAARRSRRQCASCQVRSEVSPASGDSSTDFWCY